MTQIFLRYLLKNLIFSNFVTLVAVHIVSSWNRDQGSGREKVQDPGLGINMSDHNTGPGRGFGRW
jgi:hypothetical protein